MRLAYLLISILLFSAFGAPAAHAAKLEVKKARYGRDVRYKDVSDVVEAYLKFNKLSFRVTNQSMGSDPNPGQKDYLFIVYEVNGREFTDTVDEGEVFTFKGVEGVDRDRGFLGIVPPAAPATAPLNVQNSSGRTALLYALDRHGRWIWVTEISEGKSYSTTGAIGQQWKVTNRAQETLREITIRSGRNDVQIISAGDSGRPGGGGGYRPNPPVGNTIRVQFENGVYRRVYLYTASRWGAWEWQAQLETGDVFGANARVGEKWVVTDVRGRVLEEIIITPSARRINIARQ